MLMSDFGSSWTLGWVKLGLEMAYHRVATLSMVFIVALYVPWCRYLSNQHGVTPQLYADNLKCTTTDGLALFAAARFTDRFFLSRWTGSFS